MRPVSRLPLVVAGAGAVIALLDPFEPIGGFAGLAAMIAGALPFALARGFRPRAGGEPDYGVLLVAGTALAALGTPLALLVETVGGLIVAIGAGAVVGAVALAFPASGGRRPQPRA